MKVASGGAAQGQAPTLTHRIGEAKADGEARRANVLSMTDQIARNRSESRALRSFVDSPDGRGRLLHAIA